jgi:AcrR family transcriptional regulator
MIIGNPPRNTNGPATEPRSHGEQTRRAILTRAVKIAAREGLAALTVGRLAKELRMSKSGLFGHFHSKRALELATLEMAREIFADAVLRPAQASRGGIERLWNLCDLWCNISNGGFFLGPISLPVLSLNMRTGQDQSPKQSLAKRESGPVR